MGGGAKVKRAVVAVPAYFNPVTAKRHLALQCLPTSLNGVLVADRSGWDSNDSSLLFWTLTAKVLLPMPCVVRCVRRARVRAI